MKRAHAIAWTALAAAVCGGCIVQSLNPFFTEGFVVNVPEVEGQWELTKHLGGDLKDKVDPWVIGKAKATNATWYTIRSFDTENHEGSLAATFFRIGDDLFCDISPAAGDSRNRYAAFNTIRAHVLGRVVLKDDVLRFELLSRSWIEAATGRKEIDLSMVVRGQSKVLFSAKSADWVAFLEKHGKTEGVFDSKRVMELKRISEAPPAGKKGDGDHTK